MLGWAGLLVRLLSLHLVFSFPPQLQKKERKREIERGRERMRVPGVLCLTSDMPATVIIPTSVVTHLASHGEGGGEEKENSQLCVSRGRSEPLRL